MELDVLLEEARSAPPGRRIEWRDRIAAHGERAIEGVRPWLADGVLAAFAVRVIERVGLDGQAEVASQVLRGARGRVPAGVSGDIDWALRRLRAASRPAPPEPAAPVASSPTRAVRREPPRFAAVGRRRAR